MEKLGKLVKGNTSYIKDKIKDVNEVLSAEVSLNDVKNEILLVLDDYKSANSAELFNDYKTLISNVVNIGMKSPLLHLQVLFRCLYRSLGLGFTDISRTISVTFADLIHRTPKIIEQIEDDVRFIFQYFIMIDNERSILQLSDDLVINNNYTSYGKYLLLNLMLNQLSNRSYINSMSPNYVPQLEGVSKSIRQFNNIVHNFNKNEMDNYLISLRNFEDFFIYYIKRKLLLLETEMTVASCTSVNLKYLKSILGLGDDEIQDLLQKLLKEGKILSHDGNNYIAAHNSYLNDIKENIASLVSFRKEIIN